MANADDQSISEASGEKTASLDEVEQIEWPATVIAAARTTVPGISDAVSEVAESLLSGPFLEKQVPPGELTKFATQLLKEMIPPSSSADDAAEDPR